MITTSNDLNAAIAVNPWNNHFKVWQWQTVPLFCLVVLNKQGASVCSTNLSAEEVGQIMGGN